MYMQCLSNYKMSTSGGICEIFSSFKPWRRLEVQIISCTSQSRKIPTHLTKLYNDSESCSESTTKCVKFRRRSRDCKDLRHISEKSSPEFGDFLLPLLLNSHCNSMYHPPQLLKLAPAMYKQYNLKHCNFIGTGNHIVYSCLNDPGHGDRNWQMTHDISWMDFREYCL